MANKIGTAILELVTDVSKMTSGINTGVSAVKGLESQVQSTSKIISGIGQALAGAFAATALIGLGKEFLDVASNINDLSARLKISTDTVQEWQAVFGQAGVEIESVAKASDQLTTKIVGGDKSAVAALEKMGLSIEALKAMKPEDRFNTVADAVGNIQDAAEQLYASKTLFGKGGPELLAALDGHLTDTIQKMRDMGLVIDEETIKAADDFGDQLGFLGKQLLGIVGTVVGPLLPALSALGNILSWLGRNVIGPVLNVAVKGAMTLLAGFVEVVTDVLSRIAALGSKIPGVGDKFKAVSEALKDVSKNTGQYMANLWNQTDKVGTSADQAKPKMLGLGGAIDDGGKKAKKAAEEFDRLVEKINDLNRANAAPIFKQPEFNPAEGELPELARIRAISDAYEQLKKSSPAKLAVSVDAQSIEQSIAGAGAFGLESIGKALENIIHEESISGWGLAVQSFPEILQQALTGGGGLLGAVQALGSKIGSIFGEGLFKAGGLLNGLGNKLAGMFGSSFGLALPGIGAALGALVGPALAKLWDGIKRAFGGPSKEEVQGRNIAADFEAHIASTLTSQQRAEAGADAWKQTVIGVRDAYIAAGRSAAEAENAVRLLWEATKQGPAAVKAVIEEIEKVTGPVDKARERASRFGPSQDELKQTAKDAEATYEYMRDSGQYTAEQIQAAFEAAQEAAAAAGDAAAQAWLDAKKASSAGMQEAEKELQGLIDKRNALVQGIAAEAPEEVMGVIETQQRAQLDVLDKQIEEKADAYAKLADETGQKMADAIVEALKNIHIEPVHVPVVVDGPSNEAPEHTPGNRGDRDFSGADYNGEVPEAAHTGALVTSGGLRRYHTGTMPVVTPDRRLVPAMGTADRLAPDEVPAILQVGEAVLNRPAVRALGETVIAALNHGAEPFEALQEHAPALAGSGSGSESVSTDGSGVARLGRTLSTVVGGALEDPGRLAASAGSTPVAPDDWPETKAGRRRIASEVADTIVESSMHRIASRFSVLHVDDRNVTTKTSTGSASGARLNAAQEPGATPSTAHRDAPTTPSGITRYHDGSDGVGASGPTLGGDEVPAILQVGEAVLNRRAVAGIGEDVIAALNHGAAPAEALRRHAPAEAVSGSSTTVAGDRMVGVGRTLGAAMGAVRDAPASIDIAGEMKTARHEWPITGEGAVTTAPLRRIAERFSGLPADPVHVAIVYDENGRPQVASHDPTTKGETAGNAHSGVMVTPHGIRRYHAGTERVERIGTSGQPVSDELPAIRQASAAINRPTVQAIGQDLVAALPRVGSIASPRRAPADASDAVSSAIATTRTFLDEQHRLVVSSSHETSEQVASDTKIAWTDLAVATRKTAAEILSDLHDRFSGLHLDPVRVPIAYDAGPLDDMRKATVAVTDDATQTVRERAPIMAAAAGKSADDMIAEIGKRFSGLHIETVKIPVEYVPYGGQVIGNHDAGRDTTIYDPTRFVDPTGDSARHDDIAGHRLLLGDRDLGGASMLRMVPMARGGFGHFDRPTHLLVGEAGVEDVVAGGAGRDLGRDVATEIARQLPSILPTGPGTPPDIVVHSHLYIDGLHTAESTVRHIERGNAGLDLRLRDKLVPA